MQSRASFPNTSFGVWRGSDIAAGGTGSGMGQANQGTGMLSQGIGSVSAGWEPTVFYLIGLIVAEMVLFHILGRILK